MSYTDIFMKCVEVILKAEGGYINNPVDPGGETNMGICQRNYPELDIKNLTRNQAIEIYFKDYWSKMNLLGITDETAILELFDMGVNAGIRTAIKLAQKLVGAFADGIIGDETTEMINSFPADFVELYKANRKMYYLALVRRKPQLVIFLKGWLHRVDNCHFEIIES
jgi:lysozyme family protein